MQTHCGQCGTRNPSGAQFCVRCGRPLVQQSLSVWRRYERWWVAGALVVALLIWAAISDTGTKGTTPVPTPQAGVGAGPATPTPGAAVALNHDATWYRDIIKGLHIVGSVHNSSDTYQGSVQVAATIYDASGAILDTPSTFTKLDDIPPGQDAAYDIISEQAPHATRYVLSVEASDDPYYVPMRLKLSALHDFIDRDVMHITGQISNKGTVPTRSNEAICTFYDNQDNVVGVENAYTNRDTLPPDASGGFTCTLYDNVSKVVRYLVQAQARGQ